MEDSSLSRWPAQEREDREREEGGQGEGGGWAQTERVCSECHNAHSKLLQQHNDVMSL